jgi:hypothetical protein
MVVAPFPLVEPLDGDELAKTYVMPPLVMLAGKE